MAYNEKFAEQTTERMMKGMLPYLQVGAFWITTAHIVCFRKTRRWWWPFKRCWEILLVDGTTVRLG